MQVIFINGLYQCFLQWQWKRYRRICFSDTKVENGLKSISIAEIQEITLPSFFNLLATALMASVGDCASPETKGVSSILTFHLQS
jgi:hypothetical protein